MKKLFLLFIFVCITISVFCVYLLGVSWKPSLVKYQSLKDTKTEVTTDSTEDSYTYSLIKVATVSSVSLIPNFRDKKDVQSLFKDNGCQYAVNGGFYDEAGDPLGLFVTNKEVFGNIIQSRLFNGYFWVNFDDLAFISNSQPDTPYRLALQSGPLLILNGEILQLTINNDERARRIVVAKTLDNQLVFFTFYSADSVFSGPLLSELPNVVLEASYKESLGITQALNLDGGSASAFYNEKTILSELTPVGSIFCIKKL